MHIVFLQIDLDVRMRRPVLLVSLSLDSENFDAGDDVEFQLTIRHSELSPVLATNISVVVIFPDSFNISGSVFATHCNTTVTTTITDSELQIQFAQPLFVYGLDFGVDWFNCSFLPLLSQIVHPSETVSVNATAYYRSAPIGRMYATSAVANGTVQDLKLATWIEGPSLYHVKNCGHSITSTPVSNGETVFLHLNVTLPESTTSLNYTVILLLCRNDTDVRLNGHCFYGCANETGQLTSRFAVTADLGINMDGEFGDSVSTTTPSVQLGKIVNTANGFADDGDIVTIKVAVEITGGQAGQAVILHSVLSYDAGIAMQSIDQCDELTILSSALELSMSALGSDTIEAGHATLLNATIRDRSWHYSAIRNFSFRLTSNISFQVIGPLKLYYLNSSTATALMSTNYTFNRQRSISLSCNDLVMVSFAISISPDVRYNASVYLEAVVEYSDYG